MCVKNAPLNIVKRTTRQNMPYLTYLRKKCTSDNSCKLKSALIINNIYAATLIRKISPQSNSFQLEEITVVDEIICPEE
jgi:hypothetical protein